MRLQRKCSHCISHKSYSKIFVLLAIRQIHTAFCLAEVMQYLAAQNFHTAKLHSWKTSVYVIAINLFYMLFNWVITFRMFCLLLHLFIYQPCTVFVFSHHTLHFCIIHTPLYLCCAFTLPKGFATCLIKQYSRTVYKDHESYRFLAPKHHPETR